MPFILKFRGIFGYLFLQKEAIYGLTEIYRNKIRSARLVANPGCYPTTILLPLVPLLKVGFFLFFHINHKIMCYNKGTCLAEIRFVFAAFTFTTNHIA